MKEAIKQKIQSMKKLIIVKITSNQIELVDVGYPAYESSWLFNSSVFSHFPSLENNKIRNIWTVSWKPKESNAIKSQKITAILIKNPIANPHFYVWSEDQKSQTIFTKIVKTRLKAKITIIKQEDTQYLGKTTWERQQKLLCLGLDQLTNKCFFNPKIKKYMMRCLNVTRDPQAMKSFILINLDAITSCILIQTKQVKQIVIGLGLEMNKELLIKKATLINDFGPLLYDGVMVTGTQKAVSAGLVLNQEALINKTINAFQKQNLGPYKVIMTGTNYPFLSKALHFNFKHFYQPHLWVWGILTIYQLNQRKDGYDFHHLQKQLNWVNN